MVYCPREGVFLGELSKTATFRASMGAISAAGLKGSIRSSVGLWTLCAGHGARRQEGLVEFRDFLTGHQPGAIRIKEG